MFLQAKDIGLPRSLKRRATFDGVICFGGTDWWYHNRGHYDLQMMRHFSQSMPVLYVNSLGVRVPSLGQGRMFVHRVTRKLRSMGRGLVRVRENFGVASPFTVPGRVGMAVSSKLLAPQIRHFARAMRIRRPLVWVNCVSAVEVLDLLKPVGVIYERTDRAEAFPESDSRLILSYDRRLKRSADLTLYCSRMLLNEEASNCCDALYVDHGVDYDRFATAGDDPKGEPADVAGIARPRVGFVGGIDAHTFDPPLFVEVARRLSDVQFVIVGSCSLPDGWCADLPNVHLLGRRPYEQVAAYMAACDVLIMPWNQSLWIQACNPVKLKEYLAVGRPVVSTHFAELDNYAGFVRVARGAGEFSDQIRQALAEGCDVGALRRRVEEETWQQKHERVIERLAQLGLTPEKQTVVAREKSLSCGNTSLTQIGENNVDT
jgi:glycosyltransferase involved in cell wall biosynthesis